MRSFSLWIRLPGSHPSSTMMPSSLSQIPRSFFLCPAGVAKPFPAARRPLHSLRHTHATAALAPERRWHRRAVTYAQTDDQGAPVTDAQTEEKETSDTDEVEVPPFKAKSVTDAEWEEEVLKSPVPVFVDFWAPWCGPCRMIGPTIDELIDEFGNQIKAVKVNTDKSPGIATEYGIRSIPTCIVFKDGEKKETIIGAVKKPVLKSSIMKHLA